MVDWTGFVNSAASIKNMENADRNRQETLALDREKEATRQREFAASFADQHAKLQQDMEAGKQTLELTKLQTSRLKVQEASGLLQAQLEADKAETAGRLRSANGSAQLAKLQSRPEWVRLQNAVALGNVQEASKHRATLAGYVSDFAEIAGQEVSPEVSSALLAVDNQIYASPVKINGASMTYGEALKLDPASANSAVGLSGQEAALARARMTGAMTAAAEAPVKDADSARKIAETAAGWEAHAKMYQAQQQSANEAASLESSINSIYAKYSFGIQSGKITQQDAMRGVQMSLKELGTTYPKAASMAVSNFLKQNKELDHSFHLTLQASMPDLIKMSAVPAGVPQATTTAGKVDLTTPVPAKAATTPSSEAPAIAPEVQGKVLSTLERYTARPSASLVRDLVAENPDMKETLISKLKEEYTPDLNNHKGTIVMQMLSAATMPGEDGRFASAEEENYHNQVNRVLDARLAMLDSNSEAALAAGEEERKALAVKLAAAFGIGVAAAATGGLALGAAGAFAGLGGAGISATGTAVFGALAATPAVFYANDIMSRGLSDLGLSPSNARESVAMGVAELGGGMMAGSLSLKPTDLKADAEAMFKGAGAKIDKLNQRLNPDRFPSKIPLSDEEKAAMASQKYSEKLMRDVDATPPEVRAAAERAKPRKYNSPEEMAAEANRLEKAAKASRSAPVPARDLNELHRLAQKIAAGGKNFTSAERKLRASYPKEIELLLKSFASK
jgi:hypothetical protein